MGVKEVGGSGNDRTSLINRSGGRERRAADGKSFIGGKEGMEGV